MRVSFVEPKKADGLPEPVSLNVLVPIVVLWWLLILAHEAVSYESKILYTVFRERHAFFLAPSCPLS
jgi:hypothetical protein